MTADQGKPWGVPDRWQCPARDGEKQCVYGRDHKIAGHLFRDVTKPPMPSDHFLDKRQAPTPEAG